MLASEFVPAGTAAKAAIKVKKLAKVAKAGKLATKAAKLANTTVGKIVVSKIKSGAKLTKRDVAVVNQIAVAQDVDPTTPNVMTKEEFSQVAPGETQANAPMVQEPTQAAKGYASNSFTETSNQEPQSQTLPTNTNSNTLAEPLPTTTKNNTMLYVGVGVLGLGIIYALNQKTKTNE